MFSGMPIAFALGVVAVLFMCFFMPASSLDTVTQNVYEEMASITLLSIPLFILKGAAIGRSRRRPATSISRCTPGCSASRAASASPTCSPARCSRRWPDRARRPARRSAAPAFRRCASAAIRPASPPASSPPAARSGILLPPSITMILYAVAAEAVAGPAVPRRHRPGRAAGRAVRRSTRCSASARNTRLAQAAFERDGTRSAYLDAEDLHAAREGRDAAARAAVRDPADRRDGRAVRRLRDAVGDRRPRRRARAGADRRRLRRLAAEGPGADPRRDAQGIDDADVHHRHVAAVLVRDELPAHQPVGGAVRSSRCTCRSGCCWRRFC